MSFPNGLAAPFHCTIMYKILQTSIPFVRAYQIHGPYRVPGGVVCRVTNHYYTYLLRARPVVPWITWIISPFLTGTGGYCVVNESLEML